MKTIIRTLLIGLGLLTATLVQAQDTNIDWSTAADWQVALQAIEQVPPMPADDVTNGATFWSAQHAPGSAEPWPPLPGNILDMSAWDLGDGTYLLDDLGYRYHAHRRHKASSQSLSTSDGTMIMADDDGPILPGDDDDDTNDYSPAGLVGLSPDYGTNLYIAQVSQGAGMYSGIISNTIVGGGFPYEIQYTYDLESTNGWQSANWLFYGSDVTNWTTFSVPMTSPTNMFFRVRSWQSIDDSGLPTWWEEEYFGTNNVDPYGDPMGDGWNNLEMFQNGMNPNLWYTPPAPQGVTVAFDGSNNLTAIDWTPSPGAVTNYIVERDVGYWSGGDTEDFNVSPGTTYLSDNLSSVQPDVWNDGTLDVSYKIEAQYAGGNSAWSASIPLQQNTVSASIVPGADGTTVLVVSGIPANTTAIQLIYYDQVASLFWDDFSYNTNIDIPISDFINGEYVLPPSLQSLGEDAYNQEVTPGFVQSVSANGDTSAQDPIINNSDSPPFYDGRVQMKQNLIFLLRAANDDNSFGYYTGAYSSQNPRRFPTTYAEASFYQAYTYDGYNNLGYYPDNPPLLNVFQPFQDNYMFMNCVFDPSRLAGGGMTNGVAFYNNSVNDGSDGYLIFNNPPAYSFTTPADDVTNIPALGPNLAQWYGAGSYCYPVFNLPRLIAVDTVDYPGTNVMLSGISNIFGLPFLSTEIAHSDSSTTTLYPGQATAQNSGDFFYTQTAQPGLQTVEYDFWNANDGYYDNNGNWITPEPLPEGIGFSPTNQSNHALVVPVGSTIQIAGYAKMAVTNGYPGTYAYLGQYFANAYQIDDNGDMTTNTAGVVSPYGYFTPTHAGPAALVTMPDPDTGAQGTTTVYCVSLNVDANHDGNMDLNFGGTDATSPIKPYVFWCNNNFDRWDYDEDDSTNYMDDVLPGDNSDAPQNLDPNDPDCNYTVSGYREIPTTRDLEDFSRLWVCGVTSNLLAALPTNSTVTLSWGDVGNPNPNNPTIDLFEAADPDGGIGYLTNETIAADQIDPLQSSYVGRLGPGQSIQINASTFANNWAGNYFIWCGVSNGTGGLTLTIADGNGNILAQNTAYIQIEDIKNMYERWTVGDAPNSPPSDEVTNAADNLPGPVYQPFQYPLPQTTNTPYILFVHGWNVAPWEKDRFAESAFKRLYWQGYQGRFGEFRWPTTYLNSTGNSIADDAILASIYDPGEYNAWNSSDGLLNLLETLHTTYGNNVYMLAHSMGNIVAGEALRKAAQQGLGQLVNTYVASQGAVPGHCYDSTLSDADLLDFGPAGFYGPTTANIYNDWLATNSAAVGTRINFYNTNDYALNSSHWQLDEKVKPDSVIGIAPPYGYNGSPSDNPPLQDGFYSTYPPYIGPLQTVLYLGNANSVSNRYEITAFAAEPRSLAMGTTPDVGGLNRNVDLTRSSPTRIWPVDSNNYIAHFWHSAEFRGDYWQMQGYWNELLSSEAFNLK